MHPELFEVPLSGGLTVKSYGLMMVIGFLVAVSIIRRLSRKFTPDPLLITNAALYSLIAGVVGARIFYVVHYWRQFSGEPLKVFAIWEGGLELLGGVLLAITVILVYLWRNKLPIRRYLDVLAIGLFAALAFGRIGCFLNGCCYGKPTDAAWGVRFPYGSYAYRSQVSSDLGRNRAEPHLKLPPSFFEYGQQDGLKPFGELSDEQKLQVTEGPYRCLAVHPTQLYSSGTAAVCCLLLYLFWKRYNREEAAKNARGLLAKPGCTFAMLFLVYPPIRFGMEFLRDDNPFEYGWWALYKGGTVSQNIAIWMFATGVVLTALFSLIRADAVPAGVKQTSCASAKQPQKA